MKVAELLGQSRVVIVAGKGGVGKTTVCAAVARAASHQGMSVLIVELEGKTGLPECFGREEAFGYDEVLLAPRGQGRGEIAARTLTPDDALLEYLADHGMRRISKRLVSSGTLDVVATAAPGIRDILVLGKVKQLERSQAADLIVLDAPAAGHTMTFLSSAQGFLDAVRVGPIRVQATDVIELLSDPSRCQVMLVTLPEETPVNEVVETAFNLEDRIGVSLGPVVVNGLYPVLEGLDADPASLEGSFSLRPGEAERLRAAARFREGRQQLQSAQLARLAEALPLPELHLPYLFSADIGPPEVEELASALADGIRSLPHDLARSGSQ
jgi:anion-transporting  ArsA/GET3 family ATPase